jgi:hypothetical protein
MSVQSLPVPENPGKRRQPESCTRAVFLAEQRDLGPACDFPGCDRHAEQGMRMCDHHVMVRIASNGSWVDDHHSDGGHG